MRCVLVGRSVFSAAWSRRKSTLGTFLRSFRWGHVRQLDRVSRGRGRQAGCRRRRRASGGGEPDRTRSPGCGLRERKPYRTYDPVVLYAYELDKVLFRIERAGFVVYSVLSVREYANYHGLELRFAKCQMVVTQLADMKRWDLTNDEMVEELQLAGFLDDIDDDISSRREGRRSDRRDGAKGTVRCLPLPHLRGQTAEVPHGDHLRRGVQPVSPQGAQPPHEPPPLPTASPTQPTRRVRRPRVAPPQGPSAWCREISL